MDDTEDVKKTLEDFELLAKYANVAYSQSGDNYNLKSPEPINPLPIATVFSRLDESEMRAINTALGEPKDIANHPDMKKLTAYLKMKNVTKGEKIGHGSRAVAFKIPASDEYPHGAILRIAPIDEKKRITDESVLQPYHSTDREGINLGGIKAEILPAVLPVDKAALKAAKATMPIEAQTHEAVAARAKELKDAALKVFLTKAAQENPNVVDTDMAPDNLFIGPTHNGQTILGNLDATGMKNKSDIIASYRTVEAGEKKFNKIWELTKEFSLPLDTKLPVSFDQKRLQTAKTNDLAEKQKSLVVEAKKQTLVAEAKRQMNEQKPAIKQTPEKKQDMAKIAANKGKGR